MVDELGETLTATIEPLDLWDRQVRVDGVLSSEPSLAVGTIRHKRLHALEEYVGEKKYGLVAPLSVTVVGGGVAHHFHEKKRENDGQTSAKTVLPDIAHHFHL
jgi:hypothetical protein